MKISIATSIVILFSTPATAITFNYNEALDGDLDERASIILTADVGINTVSGSMPISGPGEVDLDAFVMLIPDGLEMTSGAITVATFSGNVIGTGWAMDEFDISIWESVQTVDVWPFLTPDTTIPVFLSNTPHRADYYKIHSSLSSFGPPPGNVDYEIIFEIVAIPIPPAIWLFASALGLLGWMRRRRS